MPKSKPEIRPVPRVRKLSGVVQLTDWEDGTTVILDLANVTLLHRLGASIDDYLGDGRVTEIGERTKIMTTDRNILLVRETPEEILAAMDPA